MADLLLSQRIAKDVNFLYSVSDDERSKYDIRLFIIQAYKLLVPKALFYLGKDGNTDTVSEIVKEGKITKRTEIYDKYAKLPFKVFFIENETGGILCEQLEDSISLTIITAGGTIHPVSLLYCGIVNGNYRTGKFFRSEKYRLHGTEESLPDFASILVNILQILVFMNTKNVIKHEYKHTKKESSLIPKPLLPFYSYHILDIFREKKVFDGLENIKDFINSDKTNTEERRACIVRGHFKNRSTGIFWWSDFVRNKKNIDKGFVDKDYKLNI